MLVVAGLPYSEFSSVIITSVQACYYYCQYHPAASRLPSSVSSCDSRQTHVCRHVHVTPCHPFPLLAIFYHHRTNMSTPWLAGCCVTVNLFFLFSFVFLPAQAGLGSRAGVCSIVGVSRLPPPTWQGLGEVKWRRLRS